MKYSVLIIGAGQLGSRYLQGLVQVGFSLDIYIVDPNQRSLDVAISRWKEADGASSHHSLVSSVTYENIPSLIDLVICTTTANVRSVVVNDVVKHAKVKYWILEKVLAPSVLQIDSIVESVRSQDGTAWVNTPRRMIDWYKNVKNNLSDSPIHLSVKGGGWGLACNGIHFLDMFAWWAGDSIVDVDIAQLDSEWFESKRSGFWEVTGNIKVATFRGSTMRLECRREREDVLMNLKQDPLSWIIQEGNCSAIRSDGLDIHGTTPLQSQMTTQLVESILADGVCELPKLSVSAAIHSVFISAMTDHWVEYSKADSSQLLIT